MRHPARALLAGSNATRQQLLDHSEAQRPSAQYPLIEDATSLSLISALTPGRPLAQVYAGRRGGREKVAVKVMQVPADHRERVLREFSQESLLLSICYTDFVLSFRGAPLPQRPACLLQEVAGRSVARRRRRRTGSCDTLTRPKANTGLVLRSAPAGVACSARRELDRRPRPAPAARRHVLAGRLRPARVMVGAASLTAGRVTAPAARRHVLAGRPRRALAADRAHGLQPVPRSAAARPALVERARRPPARSPAPVTARPPVVGAARERGRAFGAREGCTERLQACAPRSLGSAALCGALGGCDRV